MENRIYFLPSDDDDDDEPNSSHNQQSIAPTSNASTTTAKPSTSNRTSSAVRNPLYFVDDDEDTFDKPYTNDLPILRSSSRSQSNCVEPQQSPVRHLSPPAVAAAAPTRHKENESFTPSLESKSTTSSGFSSKSGSGTLSGQVPASASFDDLLSEPHAMVGLRRSSTGVVDSPLKPTARTPQPKSEEKFEDEARRGVVVQQGPAVRAPLPPNCYAGHSPDAQVPQRLPPQTLPIEFLRRLTVLEVREPLEHFFVQKERWRTAFAQVEALLLPELAAVAGERLPVPSEPAEWQKRDRCARLVNTRNWRAVAEDGSGHSLAPRQMLQHDVLLPASLVPLSSAFAHVPAGAGSPRPSLSLRPHQIAGVRFLWDLLVEAPVGKVPAAGCILAHTMGLGKTAQVVIFLNLFLRTFMSPTASSAAHFFAPRTEIGEEAPRTPSADAGSTKRKRALQRVLIVVPKSTLSSWQRELELWSQPFCQERQASANSGGNGSSRFAFPLFCLEETVKPQQRVGLYRAWRRQGGVLLIGYEALVRLMAAVKEEQILNFRPSATKRSRHEGHRVAGEDEGEEEEEEEEEGRPVVELLICDEAHRLKNAHNKVVQVLQEDMHALRRLLLTGTPLQNHLMEYFSMVQLALPCYFSRERFRTFFIKPIENAANRLATKEEKESSKKKTFTLIQEVKHFVFRLDSTPLKRELPPLREVVLVLPLSSFQLAIYTKLIREMESSTHGFRAYLNNKSDRDGAVGGGRGQESADESAFMFLPLVSFAGKIAAHPYLFFQLDEKRKKEMEKIKNNATHATRKPSLAKQKTLEMKKKKKEVNVVVDVDDEVDDEGDDSKKEKEEEEDNALYENEEDADQLASTLSLSSLNRTYLRNAQENSGSEQRSGATTKKTKKNPKKKEKDEDEDEEEKSLFDYATYKASDTHQSGDNHYVIRIDDGVKVHAALAIIGEAVRNNEKTLVFSLSTTLLDFLEVLIHKVNTEVNNRRREEADGYRTAPATGEAALFPRAIHYTRIDGSHTSRQRAEAIRRFQHRAPSAATTTEDLTAEGQSLSSVAHPHLDVFLLSMKAGGIGITITAATRVILMDTSFNPADDQQAIGRAYRYGQTRPVHVYRLVTFQTLEYFIFQQKLSKEWLFKTVVDEGSVNRDQLSGLHLRDLLQKLRRSFTVLNSRRYDDAQMLSEKRRNETNEALAEDAVLRHVVERFDAERAAEAKKTPSRSATQQRAAPHQRPFFLFAQRMDSFFETDETEAFGAEEVQFYEAYRQGRLYNDAPAEHGSGNTSRNGHGTEAGLALQRQQTEAEARHIQEHTGTLSKMIDSIISAKSKSDPNFNRLLLAMGVRVDQNATTPYVRTTPVKDFNEEKERKRMRDKSDIRRRRLVNMHVEDDSEEEVQAEEPEDEKHGMTAEQIRQNNEDELALLFEDKSCIAHKTEEQQQREKPSTRATTTTTTTRNKAPAVDMEVHASPTALLVSDSDGETEEGKKAEQPSETAPEGEHTTSNDNANVNGGFSINPSRYSTYEPGKRKDLAIDIE